MPLPLPLPRQVVVGPFHHVQPNVQARDDCTRAVHRCHKQRPRYRSSDLTLTCLGQVVSLQLGQQRVQQILDGGEANRVGSHEMHKPDHLAQRSCLVCGWSGHTHTCTSKGVGIVVVHLAQFAIRSQGIGVGIGIGIGIGMQNAKENENASDNLG